MGAGEEGAELAACGELADDAAAGELGAASEDWLAGELD